MERDMIIAAYTALRIEILRQARRDGVLDWYVKTPEFQKLFPEIDPGAITRKGEEKK